MSLQPTAAAAVRPVPVFPVLAKPSPARRPLLRAATAPALHVLSPRPDTCDASSDGGSRHSSLAALVHTRPRSHTYDPESLRTVRRSDTGLSALSALSGVSGALLAAAPSSALVAAVRRCLAEKTPKTPSRCAEWLGYAVALASIVGVAVTVWATFRPAK